MSAHRIKTYSSESGYVYQYSFQSSRRARRGLFTPGHEYTFEVTRDRKTSYMLTVFVRDDAARAWSKRHARELAQPELYAAAKMRLLRAFDEAVDPEAQIGEVSVEAGNIEELLSPLDIT